MSSASFLSIQSLEKIYQEPGSLLDAIKSLFKSRDKKGVAALKGVSLEIKKGEVFGLLGVNGAGKTTLSSILATLHPPTAGTILFKGRSIYDDIRTYRRSLGFCPQQANLDPYLTVYENLQFAGRYYLLPKTTIEKRANELIKRYNLTKYRDFKIQALSGGNRQRVLIARALMHRPEVVILDEPTVGLDPDIRRALWDEIRELKKFGVTVILTTHYLDEAEYLSDRICLLREGRVELVEELSVLKKKYPGSSLEDIFIRLTQPKDGVINE